MFSAEYSVMDTPESPSQTSLSPEEGEDEKSLPDSELLDSPDEEEDRLISDSEVVQEEEDNEDMIEDDDEVHGRGSEFEEQREEEDEVVPDFVSDLEDEEPLGETEGLGQEEGTIMLVEGDDDCPNTDQLDGEEEGEKEDEEDRVIDTPQSPDSEHPTAFIAEEDGEEGYPKGTAGGPNTAELEDEEEEEQKKAEEQEKNERMRAEVRRRAIAASEMKDDSASVSRELDEHELDYDEEVLEEPSILPHEDDEDEEDAKAEGEAESEDKSSKKKEKKTNLSPKDREGARTEGSLGPDKVRRNPLRDKKKDDDDGEIDEGEIDVRDPSFGCRCAVVKYVITTAHRHIQVGFLTLFPLCVCVCARMMTWRRGRSKTHQTGRSGPAPSAGFSLKV